MRYRGGSVIPCSPSFMSVSRQLPVTEKRLSTAVEVGLGGFLEGSGREGCGAAGFDYFAPCASTSSRITIIDVSCSLVCHLRSRTVMDSLPS